MYDDVMEGQGGMVGVTSLERIPESRQEVSDLKRGIKGEKCEINKDEMIRLVELGNEDIYMPIDVNS